MRGFLFGRECIERAIVSDCLSGAKHFMSITKEAKRRLIEKYGAQENDTGSPEVQIAVMTERIKALTEHMKIHNHDFHSRRGLLLLVGKRRRLLDYVRRRKSDQYQQLISALGIRR